MYATRRSRLCQKNLMPYESCFEGLQFEGKIGFDEREYDIDFDGLSIGYLAGCGFVALAKRHLGKDLILVLFHYKTRPQELELYFDRELAGARATHLIERVQYTEVLVECLCDRAEVGREEIAIRVRGEHWVVEDVEVLRSQGKRRAFREMKLAAQRQVNLVDRESAEVVAW